MSMANLGVHVHKKATSGASNVSEAAVGIPFVAGTAPVQTASKPAGANVPVLCRSWDEAVETLGYSGDWEKYTLCEFMYSHFQLFGCGPVIFCNVLDTEKDTMRTVVEAQEYPVTDHQVILPGEAILGTLKVTDKTGGEAELKEGADYSVFYSENDTDTYVCIMELLPDSGSYNAEKLDIGFDAVAPDKVEQADIAEGVAQVDACMTAAGVVPDLICAPGWSHVPVIAALMAVKAGSINSLFSGKAVVDVDCSAGGVTEYAGLPDYKKQNHLVDANQIVCWPMVKLEGRIFHLSTQLCGLMAQVDAGNRGVPYESPSNKNLQMDACVLADGTEINLLWDQVNRIAGSWGIVTAVKFLENGWTAKGNYTACYPDSANTQEVFIPVSRMFDYIGNTLIRTFWAKPDKPLTTTMRDSILQTCNIWLGGLSGSGYLYGARAELLAEENQLDSMKEGKITLHVYNAPPVPAQEIDFVLNYDVSYMEAALTV